MNKNTGRKLASAVQAAPANIEEAIRRRAFELYEERGREDGRDFDDWLRAEEEVTKKKARTIAA